MELVRRMSQGSKFLRLQIVAVVHWVVVFLEEGVGRGVSVTGQTVVDMAIVDVTRTVLAAGQSGLSGAQDVMV